MVLKPSPVSFRQYLNNEGFGYGTPSQRQKQYQKMRAAKALENVNDHRVIKIIHSLRKAREILNRGGINLCYMWL